MKHTIRFNLLIAFLCVFSAAGSAQAEPQIFVNTYNQQEEPLMVIRFNIPNVMYEKPLYDTIAKALQAKPSARFDVVSVAQKSGDGTEQKLYNEVAAGNASKVMNTLREIGMPQNRLTLTTITQPVHSSEVRIFIH